MRFSIKTKFVIVSLAVSAFSILFISIYMLIQFTISFQNQSSENNQQILDQLAYNLDTYLDEVYRLTLLPYYHGTLLDELKKPLPETKVEWLQKRRTIEEFLNSAMIYPRKDIQRVCIITDDSYFSERYESLTPSHAEQIESNWYKQVMNSAKPMVILPQLSNTSKPPVDTYFSLASTIRDIHNNSKILGVIKVDANYNRLQELCNKMDTGSSGGIFILSENNDIVYTNATPKESSQLMKLIEPEINRSRSFFSINQSYLVNHVMLEHFKWQLVSFNSLDTLKTRIQKMRNIILILTFITLTATVILLHHLMSRFFEPFYGIINLMKKVKAGDRSVRYTGKHRDEIGYLGNSLNAMLDNLNEIFKKNAELDNKIYRAHLFQREAQIQLLYSQIRPHFMYNTLNMISILIQQEELDSAVDNINKLSLLLRGIAYINKEIPLKMEIALVDSYLSIQKARYGNKVSFDIRIDPAIEQMIMPALILQPIVENAIIHGCENSHNAIHIEVLSICEKDHTILVVKDDGDGMSEEKLEALRQNIVKKHSGENKLVYDLAQESGLGLSSVHTRIRISYGDESGLHITSCLGVGTTVQVLLPPYPPPDSL